MSAVNQIVLKGTLYAVRTLRDGSVRARMLVRRMPEMPTNPDGKGFDAVTTVFNPRLAAMEMGKLKKGTEVIVSGFLQQRDTKVSLAELLERANRDKKSDEAVEVDVEVMKLLEQALVPRPVTEVIAESLVIIRQGNGKTNGNGKKAVE